jgi:tRNA (guanine26-N2/guanine27-N2)-dimethyltransferase
MLKSIETAAIRYGRYIKPLISISVDFYIRIAVQVFTSPSEAKKAATNSALVYNCVTCNAFHLQPLGRFEVSASNQQVKHSYAHGPPVSPNCSTCGSRFHVGGPIWAGPIHDFEFVRLAQQQLQKSVRKTATVDGEEEESSFGTYRRMQGMLAVISEELPDIPLFYTPGQFTHLLRCVSPPFMSIRSAILNAGFRVSYSHTNPISLKTDAPADLLWDIIVTWNRQLELEQAAADNEKDVAVETESTGTTQTNGTDQNETVKEQPREILRKRLIAREVKHEICFDSHADEMPQSKKDQMVRYQLNPTKNWGPKPRVKPMTEDGTSECIDKRSKNQNKKSRKNFTKSEDEPETIA